jgi:hypothetical protein
MQNYNRINDYFQDYWTLLYDYYSKHGQAYLVTYYHIDTEETIWDNVDLMGGYYEKIGQYSGVKWKKILTLPVYFIEETDTIFDAQDIGVVNEGRTGFVIPSSYGFTPYPNDIIKLYQNYLQEDDRFSLYVITGTQKQSSGDKTYWKCVCNVEQSRTTSELDLQITDLLVFYDYDKKIHQISETVSMTQILSKNQLIRENLKNLYDQNSGLYFI